MKLASKKDMIFVACVIVAVILFSVFTADGGVEVAFGEETLSVTAADFACSIAYADVETAALTQLPDLGEMDKGTSMASLKCGSWANDTWGAYQLCICPEVTSAIVVTLTDGSTVVFNCKDDAATETAFAALQEKLA